MGGNVFPKSVGSFPRMPPDVYRRRRDLVKAKLRTVYDLVEGLPEAPEKQDHGDIDFVVCSPISKATASDDGSFPVCPSAQLKGLLGATDVCENGVLRHFAVPASTQEHEGTASTSAPLTDDMAPASPKEHFQVDIVDCPDEVNLQWTKFKTSYGMVWKIIGMILRPLALVIGKDGLELKLEELEKMPGGKKKCRLLLSSDKYRILEFLNLDSAAFDAGFPTEDSLFRWIVSSCHFQRSTFEPLSSSEQVASADLGSVVKLPAKYPGPKTRQEMHDAFKTWLVDSHPLIDHVAPAREEIREQALQFFDKRAEADAILHIHNREVAEEDLRVSAALRVEEAVRKEGLDEAVADAKVKRIKNGLKKYLRFDSNSMPVLRADVDARPGLWIDCALDRSSLLEWISSNYREIERRQQAGAVRAMGAGQLHKAQARTDLEPGDSAVISEQSPQPLPSQPQVVAVDAHSTLVSHPRIEPIDEHSSGLFSNIMAVARCCYGRRRSR